LPDLKPPSYFSPQPPTNPDFDKKPAISNASIKAPPENTKAEITVKDRERVKV